jgi:hypothetical protein
MSPLPARVSRRQGALALLFPFKRADRGPG